MSTPKVIKADLGDREFINLYGLSDVHLGSPYADIKQAKRFIEKIRRDPNGVAVLLGDLADSTIKNSVGNVYKSVMSPQEQIEQAGEMLDPIKDKILAAIEGNHERRIIKEVGVSPTKLIVTGLGLDVKKIYSDNAFVLFLCYANMCRGGKRVCFSIFAMHGAGGGRKMGGKVNRMADMQSSIIADVYISGHTHQQVAFPREIYIADTMKSALVPVRSLFVNSGAFLGWGGYGIEQGYPPSVVGAPYIKLWAERMQTTKKDVTIKRKQVVMTV